MKIVVALAAIALAATADAAGLGRLTVLSALGEPLIAEIEIVALQPGEEDGLSARLASPDEFAAAGIDISPALNSLRITLDRSDKRSRLRLTTAQPVNEPFLDLLVELSWGAGKLVREYTFLLDPPEYRPREQPIAQAPTRVPEAPAARALQPEQEAQTQAQAEEEPAGEPTPAPVAPPSSPDAEAQPTPAAAEPEPSATAAAAEPEKPAAPAQPQKPEGPAGTTYEVKRGDTLGAIAKEHLRPGLTLNQMLIAIFRANEDAFIRGNVNLVRTGRILNIPDSDSVSTLDRDEVNRIVKEHHARFNEYRARLAAVATPTEAGQQGREVAGAIEPRAQAAKPPAPADQLRLSKAERGKPGAAASRAARDDDAAARERELEEAQARIAELERNVADQQKLLAMRNQQLAELEKKAPAKPAPEAPKPAPQAPKPAASAPKPPAEAPQPPSPPAAEAPKPAAESPKPAPKPAAKPTPALVTKAPPPEPSLFDEFLEDPTYIALGAGVVLLLIGYAWWRWRRKKRAQATFQSSVVEAAAASSGAAALGGEPTAPASTASVVTQAAGAAPAAVETEDVDPIAEADVYMAYGRDAQAEEILKEALQKDANRISVHAKLLEIYAQRKDTRAFEQSALKLKNLTNGSGPEWEKAAALGRSIDPGNASYAGAPTAAAPEPPAVAPAASAAAPMLDFDLGGAGNAQAAVPDISLDDAGGKESSGGLDFDLDLGADEKKPEPATAAPAKPAPEPSGGLDFDLKLDDDKPAESKAGPPSKLDLSSISLDLGGADATVMAGQASSDPKWQEVATKLDLAKAYEEMGDKDGARELLKEVVKDGDAAQRGNAEQLLAKLG